MSKKKEKIPVRTKRHYAALRERKSLPEGAIPHVSKNGKWYYIKVIGEDRYV